MDELPVDQTFDMLLQPLQALLFLTTRGFLSLPHVRGDVLALVFTETLLEKTEL